MPDLFKKLESFLAFQKEMYGEVAIDVSPLRNTAFVKHQESNSNSESSLLALDQIHTLEELRDYCLKSEELRTDLSGTNLVFGNGLGQADLMIIGEAPGADEDRLGEPFVGAAGQLLTKILESINFSRYQVYIANILKHRPPNNRRPTPEECRRSLPYLLRQIDLVRPKIILALGKTSATTLLGLAPDTTLKSLRGSWHTFRDIQLLVTYHPSALLRDPKYKRPTWEDVKMLRRRYDELGGTP